MMKAEAVESTPEDDLGRAMWLCTLGSSLQRRFEESGQLENLNLAIRTKELAIAFIPDDHYDYAMYLSNLGNALRIRFEWTGSLDDLDRSIQTTEQAVAFTPDDHPDRAAPLINLGNSLEMRFEQTGSMEDLDLAITMKEQAVAFTPDDCPDRAISFNDFGISLVKRYERTGSIEDLHRAIKTMERSVRFTPGDHPGLAIRLSNLGEALRTRFERTGLLHDLNDALRVNEQAVLLTSQDHPDRARRLNNLGISLQTQFERTGLIDALDRAIISNEEVVEITPDDQSSAAKYLNNLGSALLSRFERTGSLEDLDRAIKCNDHATAIPSESLPIRATYLNNLGNTVLSRFERTGSTTDLDSAIKKYEQAVELTPHDDPNRAGRLSNLGIALQNHFERTGSIDDLDRAINAKHQAVECIPDDHQDLSMFLSNLGNAFRMRFEKTGSMDDLDQAILMNKKAIASTPNNHPFHARYLNNLGISLRRQFEMKGSMDDLNQAIMLSDQAVKFEPDNHPNCAIHLYNLGLSLQKRFEATGTTDDLHRAINSCEQAAATPTAPPYLRIQAADSASRLLIGHDWNRANAILRTAVNLLPITSPRTLTSHDQQFNISRFPGITSRAVSVSLESGDTPYQALALSEIGNGILATLQLQVRSEIRVLEESHPDLARQFCDLRDQLDSPPSRFMRSKESMPHDEIENRRILSNKFDKLLATIRQQEGFQRYLMEPSEAEMKTLSMKGPIVIFNISEIRSDAFIVHASNIFSISLTSLTQTNLEEYTERFLTAVNLSSRISHYAVANQEVGIVLKWLWEVAVNPVLATLKSSQIASFKATWPRVWWSSSGLINILPIHAAGYHDIGSDKSAIARVISSYTPTIKALAYAREKILRTATPESQKVLIVGMTETPDQRDLPFVLTEIAELNRLLSPHIQTMIMQNCTREMVLSALEKYQIVHFSCHGEVSEVDPSESRLLLSDWQMTPLTVADLMALNIQCPQLAVLSACHTASSRNFRLLSESITLSSAIQLAGYPSVVSTLWSVSAESSVGIIRDLYNGMMAENKFDIERTAESLHHAVRKHQSSIRMIPGFKQKNLDDPLSWAPFIHLGI